MSLYQEFIHLSRYSRWLEKEGRRETWDETVQRYFDFFRKHLKENYKYELDTNLENELKVIPDNKINIFGIGKLKIYG